MRHQIFLYIIYFACLVTGCTNKDDRIFNKNKCYVEKLSDILESSLYHSIMSEFEDTFRVLKEDIKHFGVHSYVDNKIDKSIFLNRKKNKCLLLVLQKMKDTLIFGSTRVIHGFKTETDYWIFDIGRHISFDKDYFELFRDNNFDNIAKLARYSILVQGRPPVLGCEIDENYWFMNSRE